MLSFSSEPGLPAGWELQFPNLAGRPAGAERLLLCSCLVCPAAKRKSCWANLHV